MNGESAGARPHSRRSRPTARNHVLPHAEGGGTTFANIQIRCRAHKSYEAERWFGSPPVVQEGRAKYERDDWVRPGPS